MAEKSEGNRTKEDDIDKEWKYQHFPYDELPHMGNCFVATAVYGDINTPQISILREIRDMALMKNYFGRKFVNFYYSGASRKMADALAKDAPSAIPVIRKGLDFIVNNYKRKR